MMGLIAAEPHRRPRSARRLGWLWIEDVGAGAAVAVIAQVAAAARTASGMGVIGWSLATALGRPPGWRRARRPGRFSRRSSACLPSWR